VKGHFGPINTIAIHPDGKRFVRRKKKILIYKYIHLFYFSYASGGEDGLVRIHYFDNDYLDYDVAY
jgi:translation initiation factor 3 subunit I